MSAGCSRGSAMGWRPGRAGSATVGNLDPEPLGSSPSAHPASLRSHAGCHSRRAPAVPHVTGPRSLDPTQAPPARTWALEVSSTDTAGRRRDWFSRPHTREGTPGKTCTHVKAHMGTHVHTREHTCTHGSTHWCTQADMRTHAHTAWLDACGRVGPGWRGCRWARGGAEDKGVGWGSAALPSPVPGGAVGGVPWPLPVEALPGVRVETGRVPGSCAHLPARPPAASAPPARASAPPTRPRRPARACASATCWPTSTSSPPGPRPPQPGWGAGGWGLGDRRAQDRRRGPCRFRNLAHQHQSMFPTLEIDADAQLKKLKVEPTRLVGCPVSGFSWGGSPSRAHSLGGALGGREAGSPGAGPTALRGLAQDVLAQPRREGQRPSLLTLKVPARSILEASVLGPRSSCLVGALRTERGA